MSSATPLCRTISIFAFQGRRSRRFAAAFLSALADEKKGRGIGPSSFDCLLFTGHTGVSTDGGATIYGFNPDNQGVAVWQSMDRLKKGEAFPGVVCDDTSVFLTAQSLGIMVLSFEIVLPDPQFQTFLGNLDTERKTSQYSYGFPYGDGECNCITWLERLGLPLLTGRMNEFVGMPGVSSHSSRRFGRCVI
ncbi:MAG: hypothetical protein K8T89_27025 [Planctomycetes bacterium]|nr:hypothetical protein [Planctomycetota bacterium]